MGTPGEQAAAVLRGVGTGFGSTDAEREMARRTVARLALDSTDAALLLDALALTPPRGTGTQAGALPGMRFGDAGRIGVAEVGTPGCV